MQRKAGPLRVSDELLALLDFCVLQGESHPPCPELALERVQKIEEELGASLPDDALALAASGSSLLRYATGFSLDDVLDVADDQHDDLPGDHVAISMVYSEPFAELYEGAHGGPYYTLSIRRGRQVNDKETLLVEGASSEATTLAAFARERLEEWHRSRHEAIPKPQSGGALFAPRIVASPPWDAPRERIVEHPKLGRGRLLEERDGKWVVAFEDGTTRTLLRSAFPRPHAEASAPTMPREVKPNELHQHPLWPAFAEKLHAKGIEPERGFFAQADASKGTSEDGYNYRRRDADARAKVTLHIVRELFGVRPRRAAPYEASESEIWSSPEDCFRAVVSGLILTPDLHQKSERGADSHEGIVSESAEEQLSDPSSGYGITYEE